MTSKKDLEQDARYWRDALAQEKSKHAETAKLAFNSAKEGSDLKAELETYRHAAAHGDDHLDALHQFIDDIFVIEPQLKHLMTDGVWDFERVHRAAEALRADEALESVGYTNQCVELPDNVIRFPSRPNHPSDEGAAA